MSSSGFDCAVARTLNQDAADGVPVPGRRDPQVEEARPGDLDRRDAGNFLQMFSDAGREVPRGNAGPFRDLEGDVRRIVAVLGVARALHAGRRR